MLHSIYITSLLSISLLTNSASGAASSYDLPANLTRAAGFQKNHGQITNQNGAPNEDVLFIAQLDGFNVHITKKGFSYEVISTNQLSSKDSDSQFLLERVDYEIVNASESVIIVAEEKNASPFIKYNHLLKEYIAIDCYGKVRINGISPGVDVLYEIVDFEKSTRHFKYSIIATSEEALKNFAIVVNGATLVNELGNTIKLGLSTSHIIESIPKSWSTCAGSVIKDFNANYTINRNIIRFSIPEQASVSCDDYSIIIDPTPTIVWGTYYGGTNIDVIGEIASSSTGVYFVGQTNSTGSIASSGSHQSVIGGLLDAFLVKMSSSGSRLWATYLGGTSDDRGLGIALDNTGNVYICGTTSSTSGIATVGAHQSTLIGTENSFIAKFNSSGTRLWSSYYGNVGTQNRGFSLVADGGSSIYMAGDTKSTTGIATTGAHQASLAGVADAYLVKFTSAGVRVWGTYLGGSGNDESTGLDIDSNLNVYITGTTGSNSGISTAGSHQPSYGGGSSDGFLVKFNSAGTRGWGTYYGGSGLDWSASPEVDCYDNVYITGGTKSSSGIATTGAFQTAIGGSTDGILVKFTTTGSRIWGTYFGGPGIDSGSDVDVYGINQLYLSGTTESSSSIATVGAYQTIFGGAPADLFLAYFQPSGTLNWSTYYGGPLNDYSASSTILSSNIYLAGTTASASGISTSGSYQSSYNGNGDIMLGKFSITLAEFCDITLRITPLPNNSCASLNGKGITKNQLLAFIESHNDDYTVIEIYNTSGQRIDESRVLTHSNAQVLLIRVISKSGEVCSAKIILTD